MTVALDDESLSLTTELVAEIRAMRSELRRKLRVLQWEAGNYWL